MKVGADERGSGEVCAFKIRITEVSAVEAIAAEINAAKVASREVGAFTDV